MIRTVAFQIGLLAACTLGAGCAGLQKEVDERQEAPRFDAQKNRADDSTVNDRAPRVGAPEEATLASRQGAAKNHSDSERELIALVDDVAATARLSESARHQLLDDLRQTAPGLRPLLLQQVRASLAFQQHGTATDPGAETPDDAATEPSDRERPASTPGQVAATESAPRAGGDQRVTDDRLAMHARDPEDDSHVTDERLAKDSRQVDRNDLVHVALRHDAVPDAVTSADNRQVKTDAAAIPQPSERPAESASKSSSDEFSQELAGLIARIESRTREAPEDARDVARSAKLRLLYLAAGRRDDALRPMTGISAAQQDFWTEELFGLDVFLDASQRPELDERAGLASSHLERALARLGEISPLVVSNLNFCTEVTSFGVFTKFKQDDFRPGEQVLVYAEVDNFTSQSTDKGHHTSLRASYQILDAQGKRVHSQELPTTEEYCANPRRDYFVRYFVTLPQRMYDGNYSLELLVEDALSGNQKFAQSTLEFTLRDGSTGGS